MGDAVLVAGAGIAGTAVALALDKAGFAVRVYEAHPYDGADIGAFLTLAANGMRALAQLDAAAPVAAAGFALTELRVLGADGAELSRKPLDGHQDPLTSFRCLRRADLCAVLRAEAGRRGIPIRHGKRLAAIDEDPGGVTARFADGDTARGALLVGADGLNSPTRTLLDPAAAPPRYAGQRVFYGYTTARVAGADPAPRITMIRGTAAAFGFAVSPAGETYWFARVPGPPNTTEPPRNGTAPGDADGTGATGPGPNDATRADTAADGAGDDGLSAARWRDELVESLRPDATPAADLVAAAEQLMVTDARDLPDVARWRSAPHGRTLLVGDAAHAASPATGQGASMALEDAVVLGKAMRAQPLTEAPATYERVRRPRVDRNIATSARLTAARTGRPPDADTSPDQRAHPSFRDDEAALIRLLDWDTPLPT